MNCVDEWLRDDREVAVIGLGASGVAVARLLARSGLKVYASDSGDQRSATATELGNGPSGMVTAEAGRHDIARILACQAVVLSPGVPPTAPVVVAARDSGLQLVAEAAVALSVLGRQNWIGVTGTNGKTTTTAIVERLLIAAGRTTIAAGNIGRPLSSVALEDEKPDWLAVELSSFQLHDIPRLRPQVGVLTNLAPDHLDRYENLEQYYADKARLFQDADPRSITVSNLDDPASRELIAGVPGRHLAFSTLVEADGWLDRAAGLLMIGDKPLLPRSRLLLLGDHNVGNALAAALAVHATGVTLDQVATGLSDFKALPHRLEPVGEVAGVQFINDSKATNVSSTRVAVEAMTRPYVLLLGGRHKGEPYAVLEPALMALAVAVVVFGEAAEQIEADLSQSVRVVRTKDLEEALGQALEISPTGGAVLLSPACSSYDQFESYVQRGEAFRAMVGAL